MDVKLANSTDYVSRAQLPFASQPQLQQAKFATGNDSFEKTDGKMSTTKKVLIGGAILGALALIAAIARKPQKFIAKVDDISADFVETMAKKIDTPKAVIFDTTNEQIRKYYIFKSACKKNGEIPSSRYLFCMIDSSYNPVACFSADNASILSKYDNFAKKGCVEIFDKGL